MARLSVLPKLGGVSEGEDWPNKGGVNIVEGMRGESKVVVV